MKKIDFHIHTKATISDSPFDFDMDVLKEYVNSLSLDAIAITNHNIFDLNQYNVIVSELTETLVFPGIEINLENGHVLVIAPIDKLNEFEQKTKEVTNLINENTDSISMGELFSIFGELKSYLVIPHYYKKPKIGKGLLNDLGEYIEAGEVQSPKSWALCQKENGLTPVIFSDFRCAKYEKEKEKLGLPSRYTYLKCDELTIPRIKLALKDKNNVSLDIDNQKNVFQLLPDGTTASNGLNVVMGKRSSGKSHTLNTIHNAYGGESMKYIRQFDLIKNSSDEMFKQIIEREQDEVTNKYFGELKQLITYISQFNRERNITNIGNYIESLKNYAINKEKDDIYSKVNLFTETLLNEFNLEKINDLINSFITIIEDEEYDNIVSSRVNKDDLKIIAIELVKIYTIKRINNHCIEETNNIINDIKKKLGQNSSLNPIEEVDFKEEFTLIVIENKFNQLIELGAYRRIVDARQRFDFIIEAEVSKISCASDLNKYSGSKNTSDLFYEDLTPFQYYQKIIKERSRFNLSLERIYTAFWKLSYSVKNNFNKELSGGEKAEYNLLAELEDSFKYDIVLIDEPESSFDNEFIKNNVIKSIKEISKKSTVFVVTHNNTIGLLLEPDNIIYTEKEMTEEGDKYYVYTGNLTSKNLKSICGKEKDNYLLLMESMEAGEDAYTRRRNIYEAIKD